MKVRREVAADPTWHVGAYPLRSLAAIVDVATDVDRRSEGCESYDKGEDELHFEVSNAGG